MQSLPNYGLLLTFTNGEQKQFDMTPYLHSPVFQRLQNPGFFNLAKVDYGTVVWPGDIDIAPETLYLDSELAYVGRAILSAHILPALMMNYHPWN